MRARRRATGPRLPLDEEQGGLTSSFLAFSGAGLGGAVLSSELLAAVVVAAWPAGSEAAVRMVDSGARLWATPQPGRGRLPWRRNWTAGWLMGAYGGMPDGRAGPGGRLGLCTWARVQPAQPPHIQYPVPPTPTSEPK